MIDLKTIISKNEKIIWEGKPNKKCFILESIFNPLMPFALIWAIFDSFIIGVFSFGVNEILPFILIFMLFHLMPVWIYLAGIFLSFRRYNNTQYLITDIGLYVSGGTFSYSYNMKPWAELSNITIHRGIFDQKLGVGDVIFNAVETSNNNQTIGSLSICNISDYEEVFKLVKELQRDIYSDTMYPNDLRPDENNGYKTEYKKH